jgi:hypothetical protein
MADENAGWIQHDGLRVPDGMQPGAMVEVRFRDGQVDKDLASRFEWTHHPGIAGKDADILEYRIAPGGSSKS